MNQWRQGEHTAVIGMTGSGKTTLARSLLNDYRLWKIMLVSKPDDLVWKGWKTVKTADKISPTKGAAWRLDPEYENQRREYKKAINLAWHQGGWCVYLDETYYLEHKGLQDDVIKLLTQGRSKKISVCLGVQRPAWVSRFALSEPTHVFSFQLGDDRDLKTLGDGLGKAFASQVSGLGKFEFVYLNKISGEIRKGNSRDPNGVFDKEP